MHYRDDASKVTIIAVRAFLNNAIVLRARGIKRDVFRCPANNGTVDFLYINNL